MMSNEDKGKKKASGDPNAWSVEEVVEWLRSKGFESDVCDKFQKHKITGNVLVELNVEVLESAIGIEAYGTQVNIERAIRTLLPGTPQKHGLAYASQQRGLDSDQPLAKRQRLDGQRSGQQAELSTQDHVPWRTLLPTEDDLSALYVATQAISPDPDWYSNPCNKTQLPFPFIYSHLPWDRFHFTQPPALVFDYMCRERFSDVWTLVESMKLRQGYSQLFIQGSIGYGKSHILAALADLLSRRGKRVVYLPDCRQMLVHPLSYIQSALLCSFADPHSSRQRDRIRDLTSMEEVLNFCRQPSPMYFIVDQVNALENEETNRDFVPNSKKDNLASFILQVTLGNFSITCSLASYRTQWRIGKQLGERNISMMGGFSNKEMEQWWRHHQSQVPHFEDEADQLRVEDLTGRIPLLLRPFLECKGKDFRTVDKDIWKHQDIINVRDSIRNLASNKRADRHSDYEDLFLRSFVA